MATKLKPSRCFVEVFLIKRDSISFDFGDCAIIIGWNCIDKEKEVRIYCDNYEAKFMFRPNFPDCALQPPVQITEDSHEKIRFNCRRLARGWETNTFYLKKLLNSNSGALLIGLLKENFARQIKLFDPGPF